MLPYCTKKYTLYVVVIRFNLNFNGVIVDLNYFTELYNKLHVNDVAGISVATS